MPALPTAAQCQHTLLPPASCRAAPIEAAAILGLLASLVGVFSLPGVAIVCAIVPLQYYFGFRIIKNKVANAPNTQERFSVMNEVLPAMKLVKYYAWERFFEQHVSGLQHAWQRPQRAGCCAAAWPQLAALCL